MKPLVPIGRFSRICRLSLKALRLYDELGLLRPAFIDPGSGYRYYGVAQALEAERIRLLRSLDVPLDQIGRILGERDRTEQRRLLEHHQARLQARVEESRRLLASLEQLLERQEDLMSYPVASKSVPTQAVLGIRTRCSIAQLPSLVGPAYGEMFAYLGTLGVRPAGPPLALYHGPEFDEDDVDIEWCVPVERPVAGKGRMKGSELEAAAVAFTLHTGPYDAIGPVYAAVQSWMQEHGHESAGPAREIYLVGPDAASDPAGYRTEVQWPIR